MMYLPNLFAHVSLILWMFVEIIFTSLLLPTLVILPNLLSLCTYCLYAAKWAFRWLCTFLRRTARKGGSIFLRGCDLHRNYGMEVTLLPFLCKCDNFTLKSHEEKRSYPNEGWLFIGRFKVGSVLGMSVALEASKRSVKIHYEYNARPLISL